MTTIRKTMPAVIVTSGTILVACGGNNNACCYTYGSSCSYAGACYGYAYGAYKGTMSSPDAGQQSAVLAVLGPGDGKISGQNGSYYQFSLDPAGNSLRGSLTGISPTDAFPNRSRGMDGSVIGTLEGDRLIAQIVDRQGDKQALALQYAGAVESLSNGTWTSSLTGYRFSMYLKADGSLTGSDSNACSYSGTLQAVGPRLNLYQTRFQRTCGQAVDMFSGYLAPLPDTRAPSAPTSAQVALLADDEAGNYLSITLAQPR